MFLCGLDGILHNIISLIAVGIIAIFACWAIVKPAANAETAIRRCILPIGIITLFSTKSFFMVHALASAVDSDLSYSSGKRFGIFALPRLDAWTGWWLFCGLIALSYTFFIQWKPVNAAIYAQFVPLYLILLIDFVRTYAKRNVVH